MLCADVPREQESDRDLLWDEARARKRDLLGKETDPLEGVNPGWGREPWADVRMSRLAGVR